VLKTISILVLILAGSLAVAGQTRQFTRAGIEYVLDLPSPAWQDVTRLDVHDHVDFSNGNDPANGYLRVRKIFVNQPATTADLFRDQEKWELQGLPGYMVCSECEGLSFQGRLSGAVFAYEYIAAGKPMYGRIYYLQVDQHTFYALRFTVARNKLQAVGDQMDRIAQSFHLKAASGG
jgi:hypothetical protein